MTFFCATEAPKPVPEYALCGNPCLYFKSTACTWREKQGARCYFSDHAPRWQDLSRTGKLIWLHAAKAAGMSNRELILEKSR